MQTSHLRATYGAILALTILSLMSPLSAQQAVAPAPQQALTPSQPAPVQAGQTAEAPVPTPSVVTPAAPAATATAPDSSRPLLKSTTGGLRELSPWSMFMSADILVKAVMIGLAFASLVTWTIFIAKMIELTLVRRKLRAALRRIGDANSLAEAQFALGATGSVLSPLLAAAMREARLSAGISSDAGIKERAASSFAEIVRAEARRIRLGMGLLATIGATSPFVGLFGTVWGIMNSFIGISKSQTTNLAVVAPGNRRGAACHRLRARRGDPGRDHLQPLFAGDQGLPRTGRPRLGRGGPAAVARSRSHPCQCARGGVGDGHLDYRHRAR